MQCTSDAGHKVEPLLPGSRRPPIESLTGLRFLAALYVVLYHTHARVAKAHRLLHVRGLLFLRHGYLAVTLFFILSGFVLTYNYADRWTQSSFPKFFRARLARIYPVYVLALLCQVHFYWKHATFLKTAAVLLMVQSWTVMPSDFPGAWNFPAWTLSIEIFFYLCFPFLLFTLRRIRRRTLALWITCLVSVALGGAQAALAGRVSWFTVHIPLPLLRLPEFYLGMLLVDYSPKKTPIGRWPMIATLVATFALLALNTHRFVLLIIFPFGALIWLLANRPSLLRRVLESKLFVLLGAASYAIYLLQDPVSRWLNLWNVSNPGVLAGSFLYICVLTVVGIAVFFWFEQPMRWWIRR